ncbi:PREDICTED: uncharacterized protein LOC105315822, partial [Amphimedon queenslandica]
MANQISKKWPSIMEKRKDTSSTGPITSTASEVSLRFDYQLERTRSNSDSTDNEEIPAVGYPPAGDVHVSGDKVSLEEGERWRKEEMSDKEESTEERRNEKKRLNRNEEGLQEGELEEKLSKKLKTEEVQEKEKAVEVQNEANHSDSDATDIALTVMDYTDDFYKGRHNTSNKANSMWCSPEVDSPAANEIRASGSEENENGSSDASDEGISQPVTNSINDITDRTNYIADSDPEEPQASSIMLNIGLVYCVHNWDASPAETMCAH